MTDIQHQVVSFVNTHELNVARQAVKTMRDCINLRREIGLPVLDETRAAVDEMEEMIVDLKLELLRHHPEQPPLPGMEDLPVAKEGELEANAS